MRPVGRWFGFVPPPARLFPYLIAARLADLALVEVAKVQVPRTIGRSPLFPW